MAHACNGLGDCWQCKYAGYAYTLLIGMVLGYAIAQVI